MKNQVLSIEQMHKLKELGADTSKASMHFLYMPTAKSIMSGVFEVDDEPEVFVSRKGMDHENPVFTLQDIIELLPTTIHTDGGLFYLTIMRTCIFYYFIYEDDKRILNKEFDDCIMQSAYEMLVWVAENGYLTSK